MTMPWALLVDRVAHSRFAKDTLIFVIEDDAQDGPDHVDAHRSVAFVAGPYVKHGAVDFGSLHDRELHQNHGSRARPEAAELPRRERTSRWRACSISRRRTGPTRAGAGHVALDVACLCRRSRARLSCSRGMMRPIGRRRPHRSISLRKIGSMPARTTSLLWTGINGDAPYPRRATDAISAQTSACLWSGALDRDRHAADVEHRRRLAEVEWRRRMTPQLDRVGKGLRFRADDLIARAVLCRHVGGDAHADDRVAPRSRRRSRRCRRRDRRAPASADTACPTGRGRTRSDRDRAAAALRR